MATNDWKKTSESSIINVRVLWPRTWHPARLRSNIINVDLMTSKDFYYDNKAHILIMRHALTDVACIRTFEQAISQNKHLFRKRIVLNLNCSVGIYALFAAKAGAAKVYAIDNSNVLDYMQRVVHANGYRDVIHIIKGEIQDVILPVKEVDIILCDWMGYALFHQATCTDIIYARDKWLKKPNGIIYPDIAKLYIAAVQDENTKNNNIEWWKSIHGLRMHCIRDAVVKQPKFKVIETEKILAKHYRIKVIDLNTATYEDLNFCSKYMFRIERTDKMDGIALYFSVDFSKCHRPIKLKTDPWSPQTKWLQMMCYFDKHVSVDRGQLCFGRIEFASPIKYNRTIPNLNNIVINFEMLSGNRNHYSLINEMRWQLK